ncbi:hypothetical protein [Ktedonobacter robiniae]|uniref:Bacterial spore germination immunoglobulin-like domain-containing protein n=1 Tax=Ktedonobacter robiniae TaxID=2778365 RepID=A0ABQ3UG35_9CHLR|nr:hypothetical protein [Ktedonobacter robiniae]GHO51683.1 hypothetical protein KSB_01580 [Ktedonobacter robiniae]
MHNAQRLPTRGTRLPHTTYHPRPLTMVIALIALCILASYLFLRSIQSFASPTENCANLLRQADYQQILAATTEQQLPPVTQITSDLIPGQLSTFVQVSHPDDPRHLLDVYVYTCSQQGRDSQPTLIPVFQLHDLIQGTASITHAHSLSIGQLDTTLPVDNDLLMQPDQQTMYREYRWQNGAFIQVPFPALFPVLSRAEAQQLQAQANAGTILPWTDPLKTAASLAQNLLHWSADSTHIHLVHQSASEAELTLTEESPSCELDVTLQRLIQTDEHGLWFVTSASSPGLTLQHNNLDMATSSPLTLSGTLDQAGAPAAHQSTPTALLFDHTLTHLAVLNTEAITIQSNGGFTGTLHFTNDLPGQPSLLLLAFTTSSAGQQTTRLLLTNVLLS